MNTPQNLPCAFPFWETADLTGSDNWEATAQKQTFRHSYCNVDPSEIAIQVRYDRMIPMLIQSTNLPALIYLCEHTATEYDGAFPVGQADITALMTFNAFTADTVDYIEYYGTVDINQATAITANSDAVPGGFSTTWAAWVQNKGLYFLILEFADTTRMYSELFQLTDFPEFSVKPDDECQSRMRIECVNNCPIGDLPATVTAPQKLFVKDPTSQPSYPTEKSVATDGKRQEKIIWALVKKRWRVSFYATEAVADFCSLIPLFSTNDSGVYITDTYGVSGPVKDLEVEISWPEEFGGCLAKVDLYFTRDFTDFENCC